MTEEAARRDARPLLSAAVHAHGEESGHLPGAYDAVGAACRRQHEQAAGTGSAAA